MMMLKTKLLVCNKECWGNFYCDNFLSPSFFLLRQVFTSNTFLSHRHRKDCYEQWSLPLSNLIWRVYNDVDCFCFLQYFFLINWDEMLDLIARKRQMTEWMLKSTKYKSDLSCLTTSVGNRVSPWHYWAPKPSCPGSWLQLFADHVIL